MREFSGQISAVRKLDERTGLGDSTPHPSAGALTKDDVDGLMPVLGGMTQDPTQPPSPTKALRGRTRVTGEQKRLAASERQVRWRRQQSQSTVRKLNKSATG